MVLFKHLIFLIIFGIAGTCFAGETTDYFGVKNSPYFFYSPRNSLSAQQKQDSWNKTSYTWNDLRAVLKPAACNSTERALYFCLQALNVAVDILNKDRTHYFAFETDEMRKINGIEGAVVIREWANFKFIQYPIQHIRSFETRRDFQEVKERYSKIKISLIPVSFKEKALQSNFFIEALDLIERDFLINFPLREAWAVGAAVDATFTEFDAHAHLTNNDELNLTFKLDKNQNGSFISVSESKIEKGSVIVIKLSSFMDRCFNFWNAYSMQKEKIEKSGGSVAGIVVDIRDNTGGIIPEVSCVLGLFLGENQKAFDLVDLIRLKTIKEYNTSFAETRVLSGSRITEPVVVLVNAKSASASEIFSGALQIISSTEPDSSHYQPVAVLGDRTFGKGTAQIGRPTSKNGIFLETQGYYRLRGNVFVQGYGIIPDFERFRAPNLSEEEKFSPREEDIFPDPVSRVGVPFKIPDSRKAFKVNISRCMEQRGLLAEEKYKQNPSAADYQLDSALEVLQCMPT